MKNSWIPPLIISTLPTLGIAWTMYSMAGQIEVQNIAKGIALVGLIGTLSGFVFGWYAANKTHRGK